MPGIRDHLQPLELLDLQKCDTVGKIVDGLSRCSFGGRMLGEVCATIEGWVRRGHHVSLVYDGHNDSPLAKLLYNLEVQWGFSLLNSSSLTQYNRSHGSIDKLIAVGHVDERYFNELCECDDIIFINGCGVAKLGQIRDGYFPNAIFADPMYVLPILNMVLEERVGEGFTTAKDLMWRLRTQGGLAQEVAHGYRTLKGMVDDPDCTVFMTMSGAMTIAKMGLVTCEMIDRGMAQYVASTGALIAHGLVESVGLKHFKHDPRFNDEQLGEEKLNRVTDTLEPEENLNEVATVIGQVLDTISGDEPISPSIFNRMIGQHLHEHYPGQRGILKSAFERKVPVCIPAFVDSEVGNDVFTHNKARERDGRRKIIMDMEFDSQVLMDLFVNAKRRGIFSIGGGVPRNNTQNVAPLIEIMNARLGTNVPEATFDTGCRICPDPMWYGHLSGCTYSENASWRKMDPQAILQGKFAEVHGDATMIWPFIIRAIMDAA